jgi:hypothetical protein
MPGGVPHPIVTTQPSPPIASTPKSATAVSSPAGQRKLSSTIVSGTEALLRLLEQEKQKQALIHQRQLHELTKVFQQREAAAEEQRLKLVERVKMLEAENERLKEALGGNQPELPQENGLASSS